MSIQGLYQVAILARTKLLYEAKLKDRNLRRIVHHAILYDTLVQKYDSQENTAVVAVPKDPAPEPCLEHIEWIEEKTPQHEELDTECEILDATYMKEDGIERITSSNTAYSAEDYTAVCVAEVELEEEDD
jgi:hypothetical protein